MSPSPHSAAQRFGLMSARSAKRWAHRLIFVWLGMWLSTALLHCDEVEAAAHELALAADCGTTVGKLTDVGGSYKTAACLVVDEPAPVSAARLSAPISGNLSPSALYVSTSFHPVPAPPVLSVPPAHPAAPPPVAVYLRNSRLLI